MKEKPGFLKRSTEGREKELYLKLFVVAFAAMMLSFLPSMIYNKGIFLYYGDFNSQQMMFYQHANETVRNVGIGWDWGTDLGSNFIGSYSFYLLGSPFFWLTTLFPLSWVAYLMPWMLALKTAVAAVCAYAYIRRFVMNKSAAFIGGMLYAFSGFQTYNVFFNHFHDVTAFFPLLLLGFELLTQDGKKGAFAITVAISALINYFFFVGEVVFTVIYFFVRLSDKEFRFSAKMFGLLAFEAVIGFVLSFFILLPSVIDILENPRIDKYLYGMDMVVYAENVRIPRIIQAFFMLSDMPARVNILTSDKARWASLAGYLPMFSMCGVIAYIRTHKKQWMTKVFFICVIMACVPILNSSFILFNNSYYARWFYMPILIMCLMTAKVIDDNKDDLRKGFIPCAVLAAVFVGIGLLPKKINGVVKFGRMPKYPELYFIQGLVTGVMTVLLFFAVYKLKADKNKQHISLCIMTSTACAICMMSSVIYGVVQGDENPDYIERCINGKDNLDMAKLDGDMSGQQNTFYRIDTSPNVDNWCMYWGLHSMRTFHSVVPTSIMDFYTKLGQTRDVASRIDTKLYALRGLLSVKYYFDEYTHDQIFGKEEPSHFDRHSKLIDFVFADEQNKFYIYKNENFVPMGFGYTDYVLEEDLEQFNDTQKAVLLMKALVLTKEQAEKYSPVVGHYDTDDTVLAQTFYNRACQEKREHSCYYFDYNSEGFTAKVKLDEPRLMFFSVPYEKGWTAEVNGRTADVEKVSFGFMAVAVPAGESEIVFRYKAAGLTLGRAASAGALVILVGYIAADHVMRKKRREKEAAAAVREV